MQTNKLFFALTICVFALNTDLATAQSTSALPPSKQKAIWYKPTQEPSQITGSTIVHLFGRTRPLTPVVANIEGATVIRRSDLRLQTPPRSILTSVKSDSSGNFELILELPQGLTQVPVIFNKYLGSSGEPLLLTLETSSQGVQMNVKISERPVVAAPPAPVVAKPKEFKRKYAIGFGIGDVTYSQNSKVDGLNKQSYTDSGLSPQISIEQINQDWVFRFNFEDELLKHGVRTLGLESRYRLNQSNHSVWLSVGLQQDSSPLIAADASNTINYQTLSTVRLAAGLIYLTESTKWVTTTGLIYNYPLSINVDSGEISYTSKYNFDLYTEIKRHIGEDWLFGLHVGAEYASFTYDATNSAKNISYTGATATASLINGQLVLNYQF